MPPFGLVHHRLLHELGRYRGPPSPSDQTDKEETRMSTATMQTTEGTITFELFDEDAPKTVENFRSSPATASTTG